MIKVVDEFIPLNEQEEIKEVFFESKFPWYYTSDITFKNGKQQRPAMSHVFVRNGEVISVYADGAIRLGKIGCEQVGYKFNKVINAKTFLQFPNKEIEPDDKHIDMKAKHLVVLYYVCDSDGDTAIGKTNITPKQGRAVIFDGYLYHTAYQPKENIRCVININVI